MPKLSVVVPNYNHAPFLSERLDSIFGQEFDDYEVILLDDCSTDGSSEMLQAYQGYAKVSYIVLNEKNSGSTFRQWKRGIELAKGKYVWIAESDDLADPKLSGSLVQCLERDATVGIAYCQSLVINSKSEVVKDNILHTYGWGSLDWEQEFKVDGRRALVDFFQLKNIVPNASAVVFRRELVSCLDEVIKYRLAGDWLLWVEILKRSSLCYIPARLNYFRYHESVSRNMDSLEKVGCYLRERCKILHAVELKEDITRMDLADGYKKVYQDWKRLAGLRSILSLKGLVLVYELSKENPVFLSQVLRLARRQFLNAINV